MEVYELIYRCWCPFMFQDYIVEYLEFQKKDRFTELQQDTGKACRKTSSRPEYFTVFMYFCTIQHCASTLQLVVGNIY
jgi:hypothetical protein